MNKKVSLILVLLLTVVNCIYSQDISSSEKAGDEAVRKLKFEKAISSYKKELDNNPTNYKVMEKLAGVLNMMKPNSPEALKYLQDVDKAGFSSNSGKLRLAQMLAASGNYKEAANIYNSYFSENQTESKLAKVDDAFFSSISTPNNSYKIRNVGELNTTEADFSPMFYKNRSLLYITTAKKRQGTGFKMLDPLYNKFTDVFIAEGNKTYNFTAGRPFFSKIDQSYMQGPMSFSNNFGLMYLTRSNYETKDKLNTASDKQTVNLKIYRVNYQSTTNDWSELSEVQLNTASDWKDYSYAHPAFSPDGETLIFASNMPGGYGGTDLWMVRKSGMDWGTPENLGPNINTPGEEKFPFIAEDGTLYFASDGWPGLGGLDIFKSTPLGDIYQTPENMGNPLNTKDDDFGFIIDKEGKEGFFTSNRAGGLGSDDIYHWKKQDLTLTVNVINAKTKNPIDLANVKIDCVNLDVVTNESGTYKTPIKPTKQCIVTATKEGYKKGSVVIKNLYDSKVVTIPLEDDVAPTAKLLVKVIDCETKQPVPEANVTIKQLNTGDEVGAVTRADGTLKVGGIELGQEFEVRFDKVGADGSRFMSKTSNFKTKKGDLGNTITFEDCINKLEKGKTFRIDNIYFDLDKWNIRPDAAKELENVVKVMYENPTLVIEMGSHTDCRASIAYNNKLSSNRAQSTMEYIISRGIDRSRLSYKGYGESMLTNGCACEGSVKSTCTEYEHQQNRRTEFKIISF